MSLPTYQQYKDSTVAWLGQVPNTWQTRRARYLFDIKKRIAGVDGYDVLSITQQGIKIKDIESNDGQLSMDYSKYQFVEVGDFAMNHMDLLTGYVDISKNFGVTSPDYRVFSIKNENISNPRYFLYLLQDGYKRKIFYAFGKGASHFGRWRFPTEEFNDFVFPLPPANEQVAIATFLDRETGKIDTLIAEQEKLLTLLAEKRQATISHAVTRGLNSDAPMKDSGVAWLGEVPTHWDCRKLAALAHDVGDGLHGTPSYVDSSECFFINGNNLVNGKIVITESTRCVSHEERLSQGILLGSNSVLLSINGTIGNTALYFQEEVMLGKSAAYINCGSGLDRKYLMYFLSTDCCRAYFYQSLSGTTIHNLSLETIRATKVPLPSMKEQVAIVDFLDCETAKLDALNVQTEKAISLLKERRSALIAAAVTGKIDVRDAVPVELAA